MRKRNKVSLPEHHSVTWLFCTNLEWHIWQVAADFWNFMKFLPSVGAGIHFAAPRAKAFHGGNWCRSRSDFWAAAQCIAQFDTPWSGPISGTLQWANQCWQIGSDGCCGKHAKLDSRAAMPSRFPCLLHMFSYVFMAWISLHFLWHVLKRSRVQKDKGPF